MEPQLSHMSRRVLTVTRSQIGPSWIKPTAAGMTRVQTFIAGGMTAETELDALAEQGLVTMYRVEPGLFDVTLTRDGMVTADDLLNAEYDAIFAPTPRH